VNLLATFCFVLFLLGLGRLLRARGLVPANAPDALNAVSLYLCLPAAILLYAPRWPVSDEMLGVIAVPWLLLAASTALVLALTRALSIARADSAVLLLQSTLGNTSFLGYALIPLLAGAGALRFAVMFDQCGSFVMLSTFGLVVIALYGGGARPTPPAIARRVLTFPPFVSLALTFFLVPASLPATLTGLLQPLAGALLPLAGLAIGMSLRFALPRPQRVALLLGLAIKLLVLPLGALALCHLLGINGDARTAVVLQAAMPPMITSAALAAMAGLAPELAAAMVGYGTLAAMATLPLWRWLLTVLT
jgi:predicted permease